MARPAEQLVRASSDGEWEDGGDGDHGGGGGGVRVNGEADVGGGAGGQLVVVTRSAGLCHFCSCQSHSEWIDWPLQTKILFSFLLNCWRHNFLKALGRRGEVYFALFFFVRTLSIDFWENFPLAANRSIFAATPEKPSELPSIFRQFPPRTPRSKNWVLVMLEKSVSSAEQVSGAVWPFDPISIWMVWVSLLSPSSEKNGEGQGVITIAPQPPPATLYNQNLPTLCSFWHIIATFTRYILINPN